MIWPCKGARALVRPTSCLPASAGCSSLLMVGHAELAVCNKRKRKRAHWRPPPPPFLPRRLHYTWRVCTNLTSSLHGPLHCARTLRSRAKPRPCTAACAAHTGQRSNAARRCTEQRHISTTRLFFGVCQGSASSHCNAGAAGPHAGHVRLMPSHSLFSQRLNVQRLELGEWARHVCVCACKHQGRRCGHVGAQANCCGTAPHSRSSPSSDTRVLPPSSVTSKQPLRGCAAAAAAAAGRQW